MIFCCLFLLQILCEGINSYNYLVNDKYTLSYHSSNSSHVIAHNVTGTSIAVLYPHIYYLTTSEDIDTVMQHNLVSKEDKMVAKNLVTISGLAVDDHTLYVLEMGHYMMDTTARLSAVSLFTGKQKVLWTSNNGFDPRALFLDSYNRLLYFGLSNGNIMRYNITSSQISVVTGQYHSWVTTICVQENILYMYNGRQLIAHDMTTNDTEFTNDTDSWRIFQLSHGTLCSFQFITHWIDNHTNIENSGDLPEDELHILNLVLLEDTRSHIPPDLESCQHCDLCLGGVCSCVFGTDQSGKCNTVPDIFLVVSQVRSLSLLQLSNHVTEFGHVTDSGYVTGSEHVTEPEHVTESGQATGSDHVTDDISEHNHPTRIYLTSMEWCMSEVEYDHISGTIFWIETQFISASYAPQNSRIMKMRIGMQPQIVYYEPGRHVDSIAVNSEDGLLYWLDAQASLILATNTSCEIQHCLKTSLVNENIDPYSRNLEVSGSAELLAYVSGSNEIITRKLDGSNPKVILSSNLLKISCIALHQDSVYILTTSTGWVVKLPLIGGGQEVVFRQVAEFVPISMTFSGNHLYVASEFKRSVVKVDFDKQTSETLVFALRGVKSISSSMSSSDYYEPSRRLQGIYGAMNSCNEKCDHFCFRLFPDKDRCGCADGFIQDSGSCQEPPSIFLSTGNFIQTFQPFPSTGNISIKNILFHSEADIVAMDFLYRKSCLVWIDANLKTISKSHYKEGDFITDERISNLVVDGLVEPTDISGDWISNVVYWSDKAKDSVSAVALEGAKFRKVLVKHALKPTSLVVNPISGTMYWIGWERGDALIRSAKMDGTNVTTLASMPGSWPTDITIDYQTGRVVWVDARHSVVFSMSGEGNDRKIIVGSQFMALPLALSVWHGYTYWVDSHMNSVYVAEGSNSYDVSRLTLASQVSDIVLSHRLKQKESNACSLDNGGCSHVCIPLSISENVCLCPDGMALTPESRGQCYALPQEVIGVNLNPYLLGVNSKPVRLSHQRLNNAVKIAVHYGEQSIFWLDNQRSSIETVHVNGTGYRTVYQSTYQATELKVDWMGNNVYWAEADSKSVKCVTFRGDFDKLIALTKTAPMFIVLDPPLSHLFWIECEAIGGSLYQSTMSGSHISLLLSTTSCPDSMAIARETRTIYWNIGSTLYQIHYAIGRPGLAESLHEIGRPGLAESLHVVTTTLPFSTRQIVWVEENLFALREEWSGEVRSGEVRSGEGWEERRVMVSVDRLETVMIDVMNSTCFTAYSPLDTGFSDCDVNNGGCTHFCFLEFGEVQCGCPAQQTLLPNKKTCTRLGSECEEGEFRCGSGECILEEYLCSSNPECLDKSDEAGCGWCEEFQFSCGEKCIPISSVCDGLMDCVEGEDEDQSECSQCTRNGHICKGSGICLPRSLKCDGVRHCEFGDDEKKCPKKEVECGDMEWKCNDGSCIMRNWMCDKYPDCPNDEDEQDCETCDPITELDCGYSQCISISEKCDGIIQCLHDGKDEIDCQMCRTGQSRCDNGQCRASNRWCDHVWDCSDRSDEWNCNYTIIAQPREHESHVTATLTIIFGTLFMSVVVVGLLYRFKILPRVRSTYKQLTQASNKTVETNVCVTTNTYSELETTLCSSEGASQRRIKSVDPYETLTTSSHSCSSSLKPLNAQNPYERFGIVPVQSTTDVSVAEGPPPSIASGGYSSGPGSLAPSNRSRALSAKSRALSARSRATSGARSRAPVLYHVNTNIIWDDHINSVSDYEQGCLSDNLQSEYSVKLPSKLVPTPTTSDNDE